jgi:hypothetical protein
MRGDEMELQWQRGEMDRKKEMRGRGTGREKEAGSRTQTMPVSFPSTSYVPVSLRSNK